MLNISGDTSSLYTNWKTENAIQNLYEKLSTGKSINKGADDPAGLVIANRIASQAQSGLKEIQNSYTEISMNDIADSAQGQVNDNMQKIRDLQIQAQNSSYGTAEKDVIQGQINNLVESTQKIVDTTKFNGKELLTPGKELQDVLDNGVSISDVKKTDAVMKEVNTSRAELGAQNQELESTINSKMVEVENQNEALSRIQDQDMAQGMMKLIQEQVKQQVSTWGISNAMSFNKQKITDILGG